MRREPTTTLPTWGRMGATVHPPELESVPAPTSVAPDVSVVVMTYNEAESLADVVGEIRGVLAGLSVSHEVVLVNDGSNDGSAVIADKLAGANLSNAKLPDDIAKFEGLGHVTEISKHARTIFLAMIGGCVFSWLTIATTTDVALLTNSGGSR